MNRIQRDTLDHAKEEDSRTYMYLDAGLVLDIPASWAGQEERIEGLKDQIDYLRDQRAEEREARRRADNVIAQRTQANAALARRVPELEAPSEERESATEPVEASGSEATQEPQEQISRS
ncbi:MAG: hypothetical protein ICV57_05640 [Rubrobacter sp.]|nr:hypothetical protein [Rubrobacter sp.]